MHDIFVAGLIPSMIVFGRNEYMHHLSYLFIGAICFAVAAQIIKRGLGSHLHLSMLSVPDLVYSRNSSYALNDIYVFI